MPSRRLDRASVFMSVTSRDKTLAFCIKSSMGRDFNKTMASDKTFVTMASAS